MPTMINPDEIGKTDYNNIMKDNIKKYGHQPQGYNTLERLEIDRKT